MTTSITPTGAAPAAVRSPAVAGLHPSTPEELPFARGSVIRSFLLEREAGNVVIYGNAAMAADLDRWRGMGSIERQYLGHWHEAMFGSEELASEIDAPLFAHADDAAEVRARRPLRASFSRAHTLDDDLDAIPIPGHTPGSTAYLWRAGDRRLLFTADSLYLDGDEWVAAVLDSSDREAYVASLERLRDVEFEVLVPWAASADGPMFSQVGEAERRARLDAVVERLRRGASR